jgi:hypothetical protein
VGIDPVSSLLPDKRALRAHLEGRIAGLMIRGTQLRRAVRHADIVFSCGCAVDERDVALTQGTVLLRVVLTSAWRLLSQPQVSSIQE